MSKKAKAPVSAVIPSKKIDTDAVLTEAAQLGDDFVRVPYPVIDLLAEAREMLPARNDVPELVKRGYVIGDEMFDRIEVLASLLGPTAVRAGVGEDRAENTEAARHAREVLLSTREQLMRIGAVVGLDPQFFAIDTRKYDLLIDTMATVIHKVIAHRAQLPDAEKVDALIAQAQQLIEAELASRVEGTFVAAKHAENTKRVHQLKRLLFEQMRYISKIGYAAYSGDAIRDVSYGMPRLVSTSGKHKQPDVAPTEPTDGQVA